MTLAALLPHGIPELASFAATGALGVHLAFRIYEAARGQGVDWLQEAHAYGRVVGAAYALLVVAAVIEAYLTPSLVASLMRATAAAP